MHILAAEVRWDMRRVVDVVAEGATDVDDYVQQRHAGGHQDEVARQTDALGLDRVDEEEGSEGDAASRNQKQEDNRYQHEERPFPPARGLLLLAELLEGGIEVPQLMVAELRRL